MPACLSVSVRPFVCLFVCLSINLSVHTFVHMSVCLPDFRLVCPSVIKYINLPTYLSVCLSVCLYTCLSVYLINIALCPKIVFRSLSGLFQSAIKSDNHSVRKDYVNLYFQNATLFQAKYPRFHMKLRSHFSWPIIQVSILISINKTKKSCH